jgi:hypothetical protein
MDLNTSVLIVSAHGRGHWLASALQRENIPVTVIDVSEKLGAWSPEDLEGPFGLLQSPLPDELQNELLTVGDPYREVPQGWTLWRKDGPLELRSPLAKHRLDVLRQNVDALAPAEPKPVASMQKHVLEHFDNFWLLNLSHQLAATTYHSSARASLYGKSLKLFNPFAVRTATREGRAQMQNWLKRKNVEVFAKTELLDFSFRNNKHISGVELHGERSGLMHLQQLVWMLSSEESYFVFPKLARAIYPEGELEPEWCWVRYRLRFAPCEECGRLPGYFVLTEEIAAPWTHENLMILQRSAEASQFDVWLRIPNVQRFNKEYLRIRGEKVLEILRGRMPKADPAIETFPQEFYHSHLQIGPSPYPVFASGHDERRTKAPFANLLLNGSETWRNYSWEERFESQGQLHTQLMKWWRLLQLKKEKEHRD